MASSVYRLLGFSGSSAGKESTCTAGDPGLIHGLGRSPRERIGYPVQYSWASLVAQMVKNPVAMQETWVQSLGWEDQGWNEVRDVGAPQGPHHQVGGPSPQLLCILAASGSQLLPA